MPTLELTSDTLIVRLSTMEKIFSLHGDLRIPLHQVRGATDDSGFHREALGIRLPGTDIPGLLKAGTFVNGADKQFVLLKRSLQPLVIELGGAGFARLVIGLPDARVVADRINAAVSERPRVHGPIEIPDQEEEIARRRRQAWMVSAPVVALTGGAAWLNWQASGGGNPIVPIAVTLAAACMAAVAHRAAVYNRTIPLPLLAASALAAGSLVAGAIILGG